MIWGAGAMGGSIGAALVRGGVEVLFVDKAQDHVQAMNEKGLRITGPGRRVHDSGPGHSTLGPPRPLSPGLPLREGPSHRGGTLSVGARTWPRKERWSPSRTASANWRSRRLSGQKGRWGPS